LCRRPSQAHTISGQTAAPAGSASSAVRMNAHNSGTGGGPSRAPREALSLHSHTSLASARAPENEPAAGPRLAARACRTRMRSAWGVHDEQRQARLQPHPRRSRRLLRRSARTAASSAGSALLLPASLALADRRASGDHARWSSRRSSTDKGRIPRGGTVEQSHLGRRIPPAGRRMRTGDLHGVKRAQLRKIRRTPAGSTKGQGRVCTSSRKFEQGCEQQQNEERIIDHARPRPEISPPRTPPSAAKARSNSRYLYILQR